jgi:hypothetical protein
MSGIVSLQSEIRELKKSVAYEHQARAVAERNVGYFKDQMYAAQKRLAELDGMKSVGAKKKLIEDEIRSSKLFQDLAHEGLQLGQELDRLRQEIALHQEATSKGLSEVQNQLQVMLNEAELTAARREYYERLVNNLDIKALMALHRAMKFFDDRG